MSYFKELERITTKALELVRGNSSLLLLVSDYGMNPLIGVVPKWEDVLMRNIFPMPKDPLAAESQKTFMNIYIESAYSYDDNPYFREDYLCIEVGCHLETWMLDGGRIRPYMICDLVDEMLNYKNIPSISIKKVWCDGMKIVKFGDMFYGYKLLYKLSNGGVPLGGEIVCNET